MTDHHGDSFLLNLLQILTYFDMNPDKGHHNATPLRGLFGEDLAIALLKRYFLTEKGEKANVILGEPTENRRGKGKAKLDRWLKVEQTLYQVEVKFYAPGAAGWDQTPVSGDEDALKTTAELHWIRRWDNNEETFKYSTEGKVLLDMRPPCADFEIRPLICYWGLLHKGGEAEPLFDVPVGKSAKISTEKGENRRKKSAFDRVWVFSMSAYLRQMNKEQKTVVLDLPELAARIEILKTFFSDPFLANRLT